MPPIYKITARVAHEKSAEATETKLVEAANMASAVRHASKNWITAEVCSTAEAVELGAQGVKLEKTE